MRSLALHITVMTALLVTCTQAERLIWLGTLASAPSSATGVSADGTRVSGWYTVSGDFTRAFLWQDGVFQELGTLGGNNSVATGISADGSTVIGYAETVEGYKRAFRWKSGAMRDLGVLPLDTNSYASDVSDDGRVIVGYSYGTASRPRAVWWTPASGIQPLSLPADTTESYATSVSADGRFITGIRRTGNTEPFRAFQYDTLTATYTELPPLLPGALSFVNSIGRDGVIKVGFTVTPDGDIPTKWFETTPVRLGGLGILRDVSADGKIAIGQSRGLAARWSEYGVPDFLGITYSFLLNRGDELRIAESISPDGRFIVGQGYVGNLNCNMAYLLDTDGTYSIKGNMELRDFVGDITRVPITVQMRRYGVIVRSETVYLDANGNYEISNVPSMEYDITFYARPWLRVNVNGVRVAGADVTGLNVALISGDIDGDNEVTLFDFGELVAAFGSTPGDTNWNRYADLDGDEEVTLFDFGILVRNFGAMGDW
ncbi:MAG: hypothetical protein KatS3mg023_1812 [Armatimonadota bacterium]|nr:MAG: hypothetical protein KatS3mg023_1812 [Armatimonadota bacterium]